MTKFALYRIRLNGGGYTPEGYYFGRGAPLYYYQSDDTPEDNGYIRALTRESAKEQVRRYYPKATFYR